MGQVSQTDLEGWFSVLRTMAGDLAGTDLPPAEQEKVKVLADIGLRIAESIVIDLNAIAWNLASLVDLEHNRR